MLLDVEKFTRIWECACGEGHLSKILVKRYSTVSSDIVYRGYGRKKNFLLHTKKINYDIVTNPPYKFAEEFIRKALSIVNNSNKVAMFLKLQFLEGKKRKKLFNGFPPKVVYVSSSRILCALNGNFDQLLSSAVAYAWFVWVKGYKGETVIKWIN